MPAVASVAMAKNTKQPVREAVASTALGQRFTLGLAMA